MAIQVNGTTVIDNSRGLNNITSADTATKNALAAAGVGGKTTLITDTSVGSVSSVSVDFTGGYKYYRIHLTDITQNANANYGFLGRFTNSSGTAISSNDSYNSSYRNLSNSAAGQTFPANKLYLSASPMPTNQKCAVILQVYNPYDTGLATFMQGHSHISQTSSTDEHTAYVAGNRIASAERNNGMNIFVGDYYGTGTTTFSGGRLTVWGVSA